MRVQPHLPRRPFTATVTSSPGAARRAWSAANSPAPPEPRIRMSVRRRFTPARLRARVQDPESGDVGGAVGALDASERLDAARTLARMHLGVAEGELGIFRALEAALLDALVDELQALVGLALEDIVHADAHEVVAILGGEGLLLLLGAVLLRLVEALHHQVTQSLMAIGPLSGAEQLGVVTLVQYRLGLRGISRLHRELCHLEELIGLGEVAGLEAQAEDVQGEPVGK